ncbi:G-type lectin S-receptor-like serine/threonine-protein kinase [Canna indica]|uniref:non-specific serine/threonine protein kinase n=1 Tax=Canna indica TaxID=4628 RepID=A0AAQ3K8K7_9LILI|nr:G-type lectin S-receptor-like serine/threonine-protein kinase [Canna indica]
MSPLPIISLILLLACGSNSPSAAAQLSSFSAADSPWLPSQNRTLVSPNRTFAAGFRKPSSASRFFIFAIWVEASSDKTIVWSLGGEVESSSSLAISSSGFLSLNYSSGHNLWADVSATSNASQLILKDEGELTFGNWGSFAFPTTTILPNQEVNGNGTTLRSGNFQFVNASTLVFNGTDIIRSVPLAAIRNLTSDGQLMLMDGSSLIASDMGKKVLRRLTLDSDGNLRIYSLQPSTKTWVVVWQLVRELCSIHGTCGTNAICVPVGANGTKCVCPPGYRNVINTNSCELKQRFLPNNSMFLRLDFVSFSDEESNTIDLSPRNLDDCKSKCMDNSSCIGFSYTFNGQRNCIAYSSHLADGYWSPGSETAMFIRVASSEKDRPSFTGMSSIMETVCPVRISLPFPPKESKTTLRNVAIITTLFALELLAGVLSFWAFLRKYSKYRDMARTLGMEYMPNGGPKRFSYAELKAATNDFSNVVGLGGYGVVYKGELSDRRVIAVKRLKNIGGGEAEFWAEVTTIARMHHLNLVRLWGFCAEKEQRMLVYEYVPNGSLDKYLFSPFTTADQSSGDDKVVDDPSKELIPQRPLLDWNIRYRIALGVARAIAYLHEECLEWVLHCDIKPENILLEDDYCPKVSDFGLSKLTTKKDKVTMSRIRGTRGYMAPEWVIQREPITAKADVYSFGVVLLELVSGTRSSVFQRSSLESEDWYMPKWAFEKVYYEKRIEDILDRHILDSYDNRAHFELVDRMVKTAIWCLQDRAELRPSMGKVAKMLEGTVEITEPGKPTIFCVS